MIVMLRKALRVSVLFALQLTASLTKMSPLLPVVPIKLVDVAVGDVAV